MTVRGFAIHRSVFELTVRRAYPPLLLSLIMNGSSSAEHYRQFFTEPFRVDWLIKLDQRMYHGAASMHRVDELVTSWLEPGVFDAVKAEALAREQALLAATSTDFTTYADAFERYMPAIFMGWRDRLIGARFHGLIKSVAPAEELDGLLADLNVPLLDNYYKQEELELIQLTDLTSHVAKWDWLSSRYGELIPYTLEDAQARRSMMDPAAYRRNYAEQKIRTTAAIARAKQLLGPAQAHVIDVVQFLIYYRTQRSDVINRSAYEARMFLQRAAQDHDLIYQQLLHLTRQELDDGQIDPQLLDQRIQEHAIVLTPDRFVSVVTGADVKALREELVEPLVDVAEFRGQPASSGIATGIARIIFDRSEFGRLNDGEILVTSMTTPNMLPMMQRAGGFVTDEGGITSHAAIVARELGKPCVIGTRVATRVIHDGDLVEVDATHGIVKLLTV